MVFHSLEIMISTFYNSTLGIFYYIQLFIYFSSRFTDSKRYEACFDRCFDLDGEIRAGEICNACVLLVKRFMKLPSGTLKNWNHVVDARSGPGIKSMVSICNKQTFSKIIHPK